MSSVSGLPIHIHHGNEGMMMLKFNVSLKIMRISVFICFVVCFSAIVSAQDDSNTPDMGIQTEAGNAILKQSKIENFFQSYENEEYFQYGYEVLAAGHKQKSTQVGPEYVVGPGDKVKISVWGGALNSLGDTKKDNGSNFVEYDIKVNDNGNIIVPEIGMVAVNGRTLDDLKQVVSQKFKAYCRDCQVSVSIETPRIIRILVTGHVGHPGYVQVLSGSTLYDILLAAGGVTKQGSLRNISLRSGNKDVSAVDLYQFINTGDLDYMPTMNLGDVVHVNPIGPVVLMKGQINHPGIYELKTEKDSLKDLITFSGGVLPDTETAHVEITRFEMGNRKMMNQDVSQGECELKNGDIIHFLKQYALVKDSVKLTGYVPVAKTFVWHERFYLKDVLDQIETFRPETAMDYAEIRRFDPATMKPSILTFVPDQVINWKSKESRDANILLQPLDEVVLFSIEQLQEKPMVAIAGGVDKPGRYRWVEDMTVMSLIRIAGGMNWTAFDQGKIVRYTYDEKKKWTTSVIDFDVNEIKKDSAKDITLHQLDRVIVNSRSDYKQTEWQASVSGEVNYPGGYPIGSETLLSDMLSYAGGLTDNADLEGLQLIRANAKSVQEKHQKTAENILRQGLVGAAAQVKSVYLTEEERNDNKQALAIIENYLANIDNKDIAGRVILDEGDLLTLKTLKGSKSDVRLKNGDRIVIPEKTDMVTIVGEVYNPSSYLYKEKERVSDYLSLAGGIAPYADIESAFIVRKNGSVVSYAQKAGKFDDIVMKAGDVLIIPSKALSMVKQ